jgi:integrase
MAKRVIEKLSARAVATLGEGRHSDGGGLYLVVAGTRRAWSLRYTSAGRVRELGLGSARDVGLKEARAAAADARAQLRAGVDPVAARRAARTEIPNFETAMESFVASVEGTFRNAKHRAQWRNSLRQHAGKLMRRRVDEIETADVLAVLKPIWQKLPETASRVRGRIERILDAARVSGQREGENPARWRGHLDKLLPKRAKLTRGHHAAMPFDDVPGFLARLRAVDGLSARALEFAILTAARSGEALGARWNEIDLDAALWTIPAARMKAGEAHRVPLSTPALALLRVLASARTGDYVFPGGASRRRAPGPLSSMAMAMTLRRLAPGVTVHGFRSAFRDWAGERTPFPREVAEAALAHKVGDATERAYRRCDALEKRLLLMAAWAPFLNAASSGKVLPMIRWHA